MKLTQKGTSTITPLSNLSSSATRSDFTHVSTTTTVTSYPWRVQITRHPPSSARKAYRD